MAGTIYQIAVDGFRDTDGIVAIGTVTLVITQPNPQVHGGNDQFANRSAIAGQTNTVTGANTNATKEVGEPSHAGNTGGRSVWWSWVAPASTPVTIDTMGSDFDTLLGVYTGTSVGALTLVASDDDAAGNRNSTVTFSPVAGVEYQIAVDGFRDGADQKAGQGVVNLHQYPPGPQLANDDFENATTISSQFPVVVGLNIGASRQPGEPAHVGLHEGRSAWWTWTADTDGPVTISTSGSQFDTVLGVYTGASLSSLTLVAENDDIGGGQVQSRVTFQAIAGTVYYLAVDGYQGRSGRITLTVSPGPDAPAAPQVQQSPASQTRFIGGGGGGPDAEFRVVATGSLPLTYQWLHQGTNLVDATNSVLSVTNVATLNTGTYQVRISNAVGVTNSQAAELTLLAVPFNDNFIDRIAITGTATMVRGSSLASTKEPGEPDHAGNADGTSVWWKWIAPADGLVEIHTDGSSVDTGLAVYTGSTLAALGAAVVENDDIQLGVNNRSRVKFPASKDQEYQIAVARYKTNQLSGSILLTLNQPPRGDRLPVPQLLSGGGVRLSFANRFGITDVSRFEVHSTTELTGVNTAWVTNTTDLVFPDGLLRFDDLGSSNSLRRFYRLIEK